MPNFNISDQDGPLGHRVYTTLRDAILTLDLEPGTILRKAALCEQLGVSRSPLAEALNRLSTDGLVDIVPQSATRVSRFFIPDLREESFLREAIEVAVAAKVARERTQDQLSRLTRNLRLQKLLVEDRDYAGFFEIDLEFHQLILSFTGFPNVASAAEQTSLQLRRARMLILPEEGRPEQAVAEHEAILNAIKNQDVAGAQAAMSHHLGQLIQRIEPLERQHSGYFRPHGETAR